MCKEKRVTSKQYSKSGKTEACEEDTRENNKESTPKEPTPRKDVAFSTVLHRCKKKRRRKLLLRATATTTKNTHKTPKKAEKTHSFILKHEDRGKEGVVLFHLKFVSVFILLSTWAVYGKFSPRQKARRSRHSGEEREWRLTSLVIWSLGVSTVDGLLCGRYIVNRVAITCFSPA